MNNLVFFGHKWGQFSKTIDKNNCLIFKILFLDGSQKEQFCSFGHKWVNTPKHKEKNYFLFMFLDGSKKEQFSFFFFGGT
jgi:hypothetical protein